MPKSIKPQLGYDEYLEYISNVDNPIDAVELNLGSDSERSQAFIELAKEMGFEVIDAGDVY